MENKEKYWESDEKEWFSKIGQVIIINENSYFKIYCLDRHGEMDDRPFIKETKQRVIDFIKCRERMINKSRYWKSALRKQEEGEHETPTR